MLEVGVGWGKRWTYFGTRGEEGGYNHSSGFNICLKLFFFFFFGYSLCALYNLVFLFIIYSMMIITRLGKGIFSLNL